MQTRDSVFPSSLARGPVPGLARGLRRLLASVCFWGAVVLPWIYVPFVVGGVETGPELGLFTVLLVVHALALVGGRNYSPGTGPVESRRPPAR